MAAVLVLYRPCSVMIDADGSTVQIVTYYVFFGGASEGL
tara:strand:+ start:2732 stop:2848 length:117 start_codon:yes stop_codon:yes gene_type:complete